jgi:NAD(P)-dependent dehydrogenase (short-subunit alcohol dehydrogenase family)
MAGDGSETFAGKVAFVTGAGSGIGRALSTRLARCGAKVIATDIDGDAARDTVVGLPTVLADPADGAHRAMALDVGDADAVDTVIRGVVDEHGRLDLLFNNAGIGIGGETEQLALGDWNRIIDVNIRGVVHGISAAYPIMIEQGDGHIVNTASLAGLAALPLLTAYSMTKHAVVGLSQSLRAEARIHGVRVTALCPGAIETPLLDVRAPGMAGVHGLDARRYLTSLLGRPQPADEFAAEALRKVAANRAVVVAPRNARLVRVASRLLPNVVDLAVAQGLAKERSHMTSSLDHVT